MIDGKISSEVNSQPYNAVVHKNGTTAPNTADLEENVVTRNAESFSMNVAGTTLNKTNYQQNEAVVHKNGTIGSKTVD